MNDHKAAQDPVRLGVGATAERNTCGSCRFFERREPWNAEVVGYCNIQLPSWLERKGWDGMSRPPTLMNDADGCDLYQHSGKAYIVSRLVRP